MKDRFHVFQKTILVFFTKMILLSKIVFTDHEILSPPQPRQTGIFDKLRGRPSLLRIRIKGTGRFE